VIVHKIAITKITKNARMKSFLRSKKALAMAQNENKRTNKYLFWKEIIIMLKTRKKNKYIA